MKRRNTNYTLQYPIEIRALPPEDGGGWLACIPSLGRHLFRATGDTAEQALTELDSIRKLLIADMEEQRRPIPLPPREHEEEYSGTPGLRMPRSLHKQAAERAREEGVSLNQYLVTVIATGMSADIVGEALRSEIRTVRQDIRELAAGVRNVVYRVSRPDAEKGRIQEGFVRFLHPGLSEEMDEKAKHQSDWGTSVPARA